MLILLITSVPKDIIKNEKIQIVNVGSSQMIFREGKEVSISDEN